jgi:DNA-binding GntR family transcriptional regulator
VKPPSSECHRAYSARDAAELLSELGDEAKIIAGGQSLTPMMNFRLVHPTALVDVNHIPDLDYVRRTGDTLRVGALTRHRTLEMSRDPQAHDGFGLLPRAERWIGHCPIRTRGTLGGSIAHADATAEWCLLAALFDAEVGSGGRSARAGSLRFDRPALTGGAPVGRQACPAGPPGRSPPGHGHRATPPVSSESGAVRSPASSTIDEPSQAVVPSTIRAGGLVGGGAGVMSGVDPRVPTYASKTDIVCALLREMIISGEVSPGEPLRQRDLATRFAVSQTPIREALRRLESEGLVANDPHRGATVAESERGAEEDNGQVRAVLEALGARLAARQVTTEQLADLRALNAVMEHMDDSDPDYANANRGFHFKVYEVAQSPILLSLMRLLWQSIPRGPMTMRPHRESWLQHEELIDALAAGDGERAAQIMTDHILGAGSCAAGSA